MQLLDLAQHRLLSTHDKVGCLDVENIHVIYFAELQIHNASAVELFTMMAATATRDLAAPEQLASCPKWHQETIARNPGGT